MSATLFKLLLLIPLIVTNVCSQLYGFDVMHFEVAYSLILIFLLGIPHGAMDHIIFKKERKQYSHLFTAFYWTLGLRNALLWFFFPLEVTFFFILLSAFHFGEAQFSNHAYLKRQLVFVICWGMAIISLLLSKNIPQLAAYVQSNHNPVFYQQVLLYLENQQIVLGFVAITLLFKVYYWASNKITGYFFLREFLFFSTIMLFMNFSSIVVGITTFFVFGHSLHVLEQEYRYLKKDNPSFGLLDFVKVIFPFSILSYVMGGLLFALSLFEVLNISQASLILIMLSSLTLPHAVVMHIFYRTKRS